MQKNIKVPLFCLLISLYWFSSYTYVPILSIYAENIGASHKMIGLIIGSYGFTQMLLRIPIGFITNIYDNNKTFIINGLLLSLFSKIGMMITNSVNMLLIFRAIDGFSAATWINYTILFSRFYQEDETHKAIGNANAFMFLGMMLAMIIGPVFSEKYGIRSSFKIASIGAVIAIIIVLLIKEEKVSISKKNKNIRFFSKIEFKKIFIIAFLGIVTQLIVFSTIFGFTPIMATNIGFNKSQLGILALLFNLFSMISSFFTGAIIVNKIGERISIIFGLFFLVIGTLFTPYIKFSFLLFFLIMLSGTGYGISFPLLMSKVIKGVNNQNKSFVMGIYQSLYGLGMFIGPIIFGFVSQNIGIKYGYIVISLIGVIGIYITWFFLKEREEEYECFIQ